VPPPLDPVAIAAEVVARGHDPELVRRRMKLKRAVWLRLLQQSSALSTAVREWPEAVARRVEARLARAATSSPATAAVYLAHVGRRRLYELRRREVDVKFGKPEDDR
jgi:putative aminopeptidase FrvX